MGAAPHLHGREIAQRLGELPTLPSIVYELNQVIGDPMASISDIEAIMAGDQSMTLKVLSLANSAYYAIPGGVSTLSRAIGYVGYETIHQMVLSMSIISALKPGMSELTLSFDVPMFWKHSFGTAVACEAIAEFIHYESPGDLFTAGLVHDIGKLAVYIIDPDQFAEVMQQAFTRKTSFAEAESTLGVSTHCFIGQQLALRWKLPLQIQSVIQHHHQLDRKMRLGISSEMNLIVDIVYLGNLLAHALKIGHSGHDQASSVPRELLERIHVRPEQLTELILKVQGAMAKADGFLRIISGAKSA
jgi:HD-like signal output (HDOD) protein